MGKLVEQTLKGIPMRSESELRDLVGSLEQNLDSLTYDEVVIAADELERQLSIKRAELKKSRQKAMTPKKKVRRGLGSY